MDPDRDVSLAAAARLKFERGESTDRVPRTTAAPAFKLLSNPDAVAGSFGDTDGDAASSMGSPMVGGGMSLGLGRSVGEGRRSESVNAVIAAVRAAQARQRQNEDPAVVRLRDAMCGSQASSNRTAQP